MSKVSGIVFGCMDILKAIVERNERVDTGRSLFSKWLDLESIVAELSRSEIIEFLGSSSDYYR